MCYCDNMGVEQTPNKSQHTKLTLEKKMLPPIDYESGALPASYPGSQVKTVNKRGSQYIYISLISTGRNIF